MEGLDKFREAFEAYSDNYVIIGGTACDITLSEPLAKALDQDVTFVEGLLNQLDGLFINE